MTCKIGSVFRRIFSRENLWALAICLMLVALIIFSSGSSPRWLYQGF